MKVRRQLKEIVESDNIRADEYYFKKMKAPPLASFIPYDAIAYLNYIASSIKLSGKIDYKYDQIEKTVERFGFVRLGRGTNRVVYRHLEDPRYVLKIAVDDVGIKDNPREFINQDYLYPFVCKVFEVDPTGTVALVERVEPIRHRVEFESIAGKVFDLIRYWFTGKYVMEDIGSNYFMNWATRLVDGCPVLCDYPYMYELDYRKIRCMKPTPAGPCNGVIDYDAGYNKLICPKCGATYRAKELSKAITQSQIKLDKGDTGMSLLANNFTVTIKRNGKTEKRKTGVTTKSVIDQRYEEAEQNAKKSAYAVKARLNNMIMDESTNRESDQISKLDAALAKKRAARKNIGTKVSDAVNKALEEAEVSEIPGYGLEDTNIYTKPEENEEETVVTEVDLHTNTEEPDTEAVENKPEVEDIEETDETEEPVDVEEQEEVEEPEIEQEEEEVFEHEEVEDKPLDAGVAFDLAKQMMSNMISAAESYKEEEPVEEDETVEAEEDETKWDVQGNFIPKEEEESEEDETNRMNEIFRDSYYIIEVFGIKGLRVDTAFAEELIDYLPKELFAYNISKYPDNDNEYITNEDADDNWVATAVLTTCIFFEEDESKFELTEEDFKYVGTLEMSIDDLVTNVNEAKKKAEEAEVEPVAINEVTAADWSEESEEDELEMVDPPVGAAPATEVAEEDGTE